MIGRLGRPGRRNLLQQRYAITVCGLVQGVGFRPFVYRLASRSDLSGFVRNHAAGVHIEVEGSSASLSRFLVELTADPPPLARIEAVRWTPCAARQDHDFRIEPSAEDDSHRAWVGPDVATCRDCLAELFDRTDRRYRYPFLNCTNCGPRLTIIQRVPYDRERTTMASFALCATCRAEYAQPANRRFHAEATACPECGPRLELLNSKGHPQATMDPLTQAVAALRHGQIGALKGLGGYHLACDACNEAAVAELRRRKNREEKPLAIMVADLPAARRFCEVSPAEAELLLSPRSPIVLLRKRVGESGDKRLTDAVAPNNPFLGVMLPYTPLHHLLLCNLNGMPLVMTSGNGSDEPICIENQDAVKRLGGIADFFLSHNRPIQLSCDDSVTRVVDGLELPVRRSRGQAPQPVPLPFPCPLPTLATGGQLKSVFAMGQDRHAVLSHHLGDLDSYGTYRAYTEAIQHYEQLFGLQPELLVHDLHPAYASTRYAVARAESGASGRIAVQHHHAHIASCMAENGLTEPVIGVAFDGTGLGRDGTIWGGEFLVGDYRAVRRAAHLRGVAMPGGDQAIREPWRMALACLADAGEGPSLLADSVSSQALRTIQKMIDRQVNTPLTSSAGRLFDAVAALVGLRTRVSYEGQAAQELEGLASDMTADSTYPFELASPAGDNPDRIVVDTRPLIRAVAEEVRRNVPAARLSRRFHSTMAAIICSVCQRLRTETGLATVVLSGGVFLNALLLQEATAQLTADGFRVYRHRLVPPNDGGLCLGQLAIAAAMLNSEEGADVPRHSR